MFCSALTDTLLSIQTRLQRWETFSQSRQRHVHIQRPFSVFPPSVRPPLSIISGWFVLQSLTQLIGWPFGRVDGHGRPLPPLPVNLCDALPCPLLLWPASEAPPPERPAQHPTQYHPHPDGRPGPGAGWGERADSFMLILLWRAGQTCQR